MSAWQERGVSAFKWSLRKKVVISMIFSKRVSSEGVLSMKAVLFPVLLGVMAAAAYAAPEFEDGVKLRAGGKDIDIEIGHLVPAAVDWEGDGDKDLIVGHFAGGDSNIKLFLNTGTDAEAVLAAGVPLTAAGKPIRMDAG